ncbi:MAG: ComEC/Rec2 family competence protein, partial [Alphaproteobacteria bacterium]
RGARVGISAKQAEAIGGIRLGDGVAIQALLQPPMPPQFAGDYDSRFYSFFNGLDAVGYARGEVYLTSLPEYHGSLWVSLQRWRHSVAERIRAQASPLAAILLTGVKDGLEEEVQQNFRTSGLAHLLSISGLHMEMVAAMLFFGVRTLLASVPTVALRWPVKKLAAMAAWGGALAYLALSGAEIPAIRAFMMITLVLLAVVLDRVKLGLRLWCVALMGVLALWPWSVLTASFQMSFAATFALMLWANAQPKHIGYVSGMFMTSVMAGLATLPLSAAHFQMVSISGFVLNMLAVPLTGFVIMPAGMAALALMPAGAEYPALWVMQQGMNGLAYLASWGGEGVRIASLWWPLILALCMGAMALMLCGRWRWASGIVLALLAVLLAIPPLQPPTVVLLQAGQSVLLCTPANTCAVVKDDGNMRTVEHYLQQNLLIEIPKTALPVPVCDASGCVYTLQQRTIAVVEHATPEDCANATVVVDSTGVACGLLPTPAAAAEVYLAGTAPRVVAFAPQYVREWER